MSDFRWPLDEEGLPVPPECQLGDTGLPVVDPALLLLRRRRVEAWEERVASLILKAAGSEGLSVELRREARAKLGAPRLTVDAACAALPGVPSWFRLVACRVGRLHLETVASVFGRFSKTRLARAYDRFTDEIPGLFGVAVGPVVGVRGNVLAIHARPDGAELGDGDYLVVNHRRRRIVVEPLFGLVRRMVGGR